MPATFSSKKFALLTVDGPANGLVTIADNTGWLPGESVWIRDNNSTSLRLIISEQVGSTQLRLRDPTHAPGAGGVDLTAFTVAQVASIAKEGQTVAVLAPFVPRERG